MAEKAPETAPRWYKNGDHPEDQSVLITPVPGDGEPFMSEGQIVRRYRNPYVKGDEMCTQCREKMHIHGFIDQYPTSYAVCPGDYIVKHSSKNYVPHGTKNYGIWIADVMVDDKGNVYRKKV